MEKVFFKFIFFFPLQALFAKDCRNFVYVVIIIKLFRLDDQKRAFVKIQLIPYNPSGPILIHGCIHPI